MNVLSEVEVARLLTAYAELEDETDVEQAPWWRLARQIVQVALGTALRRGQLLALRWQDVELLEGRLSVRQAFVRNEFTSPKSRSSWRTVELGPRTVDFLKERWQATAHKADSDLVFCHPQIGSPLDGSKLAAQYLRPALVRA